MSANSVASRFLRKLVSGLAKLVFAFEVHGRSNIPRKGGGLIVCNHVSLLDPFFIVGSVPRIVRFVMAQKIYDFWLWHWLMKGLKMIPIEGGRSPEKLEKFNERCRRIINGGDLVCIYPEGQITRVGQILEFKKGIEHIAKGLEAPIIPMQVEPGSGIPLSFKAGSQQAYGFSWRSFRKKISVNIGKPLPPDTSSFYLRLRVLQLQSETFDYRFRKNHTLNYFVRRAASEFGSRVFYRSDGVEYSFTEILRRANLRKTDSKLEIQSYSLDWIVNQIADILGQNRAVIGQDGNEILGRVDSTDQIAYSFRGKFNIDYTHKNILSLIKGLRSVYKLDKQVVTLGVFDPQSPYGVFFGLWLPFFIGAEAVYPEDSNIDSIIDSIKTRRVNVLMASSEIVEQLVRGGEEVWDSITDIILGRYQISESTGQFLTSQNIRVVQSTGTAEEDLIFAVNSPDFEGTDVTGREMWQGGSKPGTVGRPIPGISIRVLDPKTGDEIREPDTPGLLHIKGAAIPEIKLKDSGWMSTEYTASVDREGFITIAQI